MFLFYCLANLVSSNLQFLHNYNAFCMPPQYGVPHAPPSTPDSKLSSQTVSESSVITPDVPPTSNLHNTLNNEHIPVIVHRFIAKFFSRYPSYPKPPVQQTGNYTLADLTNTYRKYKHKHTKHKLL